MDQIKEVGLRAFEANITDYTSLIKAVKTYKTCININEDTLLNDTDFPFILIQLDLIYSSLKGGKKRKQFLESKSKFKTVSSWIGVEKSKEWFQNKLK